MEAGRRRTFASAADWPGWCRSARDEASALAALAAYAPRYAAAVGAGAGVPAPAGGTTFDVVERLAGDASTDFGVPGRVAAADHEPYGSRDLDRHLALLEAAWAAFDAAADAAAGAVLRTGPRGGGRDLGAIIDHVLTADRAYLSSLGFRPAAGGDDMAGVRAAVVAAIRARARGEEPPPNPRRRKPLWPPRYALRRSAWHALDHTWEVEDRAAP